MESEKTERTTTIPPAFTGDILFHERFDLLLKRAYSYQSVGNTMFFCSVINNILAEIYRYINRDKAEAYRKKIQEYKNQLLELNYRKKRVVTSTRDEAHIFGRLESIFFNLIVLAHEAKLILRDKASSDEAFNDL